MRALVGPYQLRVGEDVPFHRREQLRLRRSLQVRQHRVERVELVLILTVIVPALRP